MQCWNLFSHQAKETPGTATYALVGLNCSDLTAGLDCGDGSQPQACFALTETSYAVPLTAQQTYTCPAGKERVAR